MTRGLLIGPFMLSFESTCGKAERPLVLFAKIVHLAAGQQSNPAARAPTAQVSSVFYVFFAVAHFIYSPLNPWPEILKQRRKRQAREKRQLFIRIDVET